jgi:DcaP outer membrane protein
MNHIVKILLLLLILSGFGLFSQDSNRTKRDTIKTKRDSVKIKRDTTTIYDQHPQDAPVSTGFYIYAPDSVSYLKLYGSIRLNGAYDIGGLQTKQTFSTYDIPTDEEVTEGRFFMSPYQTRLGMEIKLATSIGDVNMKLESDFLGANNNFRIRHAYGVISRFLLGQTWSVFGDPSSIPNTVDQDGPNSSVSERSIQLRYQPKEAFYNWVLAIESPNPDIEQPDSTQLEPVFQTFPDISSRFLIKDTWGHVQLAGIFRSITVRNIDGSLKILAGYGGLFSGKIIFSRKFLTNYQVVGGNGIARYIKGLTGKGQDVIYDDENNTNVLLPVTGGYVSVSYQWTKSITTDLNVGMLRVYNKDFQDGKSFKRSSYASANVFFTVTQGSRIGVEYSFGTRINKDDSFGTASRISFVGILNF